MYTGDCNDVRISEDRRNCQKGKDKIGIDEKGSGRGGNAKESKYTYTDCKKISSTRVILTSGFDLSLTSQKILSEAIRRPSRRDPLAKRRTEGVVNEPKVLSSVIKPTLFN